MKEKTQLFKSIPVNELKTIFSYCANSGELQLNGRLVKANEDDNFSIIFNYNRKQYKASAIEICYAVNTGKWSKYKVRTKDLDNANLKFSNIFEVTYEEDRAIRTALLNLRKYLRIQQSKVDQNKYIVSVYNESVIKRSFDCSNAAVKYIRKTKLVFMKTLERIGIDINSSLLY